MTSHSEPRRIPRHLLIRFLILVVLVGTGFAVLRWSPLADYLTQEAIAAFFDRLRGTWWAPAVLIAGYVALCPLGVPASPLMFAGGFVFGFSLGSFYNLIGVFLGGMSTYYLGRALGRDFVLHLRGRMVRRVERAVSRGGFWNLVGVRFLPLPYTLVNYCAALTGVRPGSFLASTIIGLIPTVPIFTWFAAALSETVAADERSGLYLKLGAALGLLMVINLAPRLWVARKRRERYQQICAARRLRSVPASPRPPAGR